MIWEENIPAPLNHRLKHLYKITPKSDPIWMSETGNQAVLFTQNIWVFVDTVYEKRRETKTGYTE